MAKRYTIPDNLKIGTNYNKIKYNREIIIDRINKVAELHYYQRLSIREIAKKLGYDHKTIFADLQKLKDSTNDDYVIVDTKGMLKHLMQNRIKNKQKIITAIEKLEQIQDKNFQVNSLRNQIQAHKILDDMERATIKDLQELGFIEKPKERVELENKDVQIRVVMKHDGTAKEGINKKRLGSISETDDTSSKS